MIHIFMYILFWLKVLIWGGICKILQCEMWTRYVFVTFTYRASLTEMLFQLNRFQFPAHTTNERLDGFRADEFEL